VDNVWRLHIDTSRGGRQSPKQERSRLQEERYGGVVVNQAVTVAGQNFYQCFVASWREKETSDWYEISIHERPSARWGSQIWIEYAQKRVFQASLPSALSHIRALSEQAADIAYRRIADVEIERLLVRETDVGPDEI
jgi:curli production assembly/transport component CsgE